MASAQVETAWKESCVYQGISFSEATQSRPSLIRWMNWASGKSLSSRSVCLT
jgi:hypothetical protein